MAEGRLGGGKMWVVEATTNLNLKGKFIFHQMGKSYRRNNNTSKPTVKRYTSISKGIEFKVTQHAA